MKKLSPLFLLFIIAISTLIACKSKSTKKSSAGELLTGEWVWVSASGGIDGSTITPETEGFTKTVTFGSDNVYKEFINDKETSQLKITTLAFENDVEKEVKIAFSSPDGKLDISKLPISQTARFQGNDTLLLRDDCDDCFEYIYVRKK